MASAGVVTDCALLVAAVLATATALTPLAVAAAAVTVVVVATALDAPIWVLSNADLLFGSMSLS